MNKYEHSLFVIILCVWVFALKTFKFFSLFVHIIFNVFLMINSIFHAFQHNSMVPYGKKKVYDAKIEGGRNLSMQVQVKIKYVVYEIQKSTLFNQIKLPVGVKLFVNFSFYVSVSL